MILGGKENDRAPQAVFFTPLNPFRNDPDAEELHFEYTFPRKGTLSNILETQARCSILDKLI